jgi:hypothetical protein
MTKSEFFVAFEAAHDKIFMSESEHRLIFVMDPCYKQINRACLSAGAGAQEPKRH